MSHTIGFIGLGVMGRAMSGNLLGAGYKVVVYDIAPGAVENVVAAGAERGESPKDVASRADIIVTMVPDAADVEQVLMGPDGVLEGAGRGVIVIDMSSVSPMASRKFSAACERKGVDFLDAPVSGGEPKAIDGTLAIMVGGKKEVLDRALPVLQAMGSTVTLTGPVGSGNITKLANQIMVAGNIVAMGEALVLAAKAGVDPEVVFNAVRGGLAGSTILDAKAPMLYSRDFKPGARISLHEKDLRNALHTAESLGVPLPFTSMAQQMMRALMNTSRGDLDHAALVQFTEHLAQVEVRKG
jgi:2-hydroxy-3-oxopropionate reductase